MAKSSKPTSAPKAPAKRKVAAKPATAKAAKAKPAPKSATAPKKSKSTARPKPAAARPAKAKASSAGFDIAKLIDHPLVADLLTVGAMAAVAAIADHNVKTRTGEAGKGSSKAVKAAGKAAAAAVGMRLMTEVDQIRQSAKPKN